MNLSRDEFIRFVQRQAEQKTLERMKLAEERRMAQLRNDRLTVYFDERSGTVTATPPPPTPKFKRGDKVTTNLDQRNWEVVDARLVNGSTPHVEYLLKNVVNNDEQVTASEHELSATPKPKKPKKAKVSFDSVVMADDKRRQINEALEQVHQSELIFETWGFGDTIEKGRGVAMLFYGPPGTGKTLVCQALANSLGRKLRVIGTADVESSAPGEAERNIRKHFADAKKDNAVLLFDECDSLIFSRSMTGVILGAQVNELLSQIERFDGVTLFTTNRLGTLDEAVNRRLALKLEFAMPDAAQRELIWKRMIPKKAPLADDVDWATLAELEVSGGYIKNAVLRAARMAACEKKPDAEKRIAMAHLRRALIEETESMMEFEQARESHERGFMPVNGGVHRAPGKVVKL